MVDFDIAEDGDAQPPENHGNEAHTEAFATASDAVDTRRAVNQLAIQNAEQDFELGLELLEFRDGQYEVFADGSNIAASSGVTTNLGSALDNAGLVELASDSTEGSVTHILEDFTTFVPQTAVVADSLRSPLPDGADVLYELEDEKGNVETISRDQLDTQVLLPSIETFGVQTRAVLSRESTAGPSPELSGYSVYLTGERPQTYFDLETAFSTN